MEWKLVHVKKNNFYISNNLKVKNYPRGVPRIEKVVKIISHMRSILIASRNHSSNKLKTHIENRKRPKIVPKTINFFIVYDFWYDIIKKLLPDPGGRIPLMSLLPFQKYFGAVLFLEYNHNLFNLVWNYFIYTRS